jgi:hypothetical protein
VSTRKQVAALLHISERQLTRLATEGTVPQPARHGEWDALACNAAYIGHMQHAVLTKATMGADGKLINTAAMRSELLSIELQMARLDAAKRLGEVVSIEDYEYDLSTLIVESRTNLLAVAPRVASKITGEMSRVAIERAIDAEIRLALTRLAEATPAKMGRGPKSRRAAERKRAPTAAPRLGRRASGNAEPPAEPVKST